MLARESLLAARDVAPRAEPRAPASGASASGASTGSLARLPVVDLLAERAVVDLLVLRPPPYCISVKELLRRNNQKIRNNNYVQHFRKSFTLLWKSQKVDNRSHS